MIGVGSALIAIGSWGTNESVQRIDVMMPRMERAYEEVDHYDPFEDIIFDFDFNMKTWIPYYDKHAAQILLTLCILAVLYHRRAMHSRSGFKGRALKNKLNKEV